MELYPIFVVWLACVTNKTTYQAVYENKYGEQEAIAGKAGIACSDVQKLIRHLVAADQGTPVDGENSFVRQIGDFFQAYAVKGAGYHQGGSGEACGSIQEVLDAIGQPVPANARPQRGQETVLPAMEA